MTTTDATPHEGHRPGDDESPLEKQLERWAVVALPLATAAGAFLAGWVQGPGAAILVLAGGALVGVIAVFWSSLRTLFGETPLSGADAYALGAPRAEEEQKRAVLRALKDLEFERGVGKISDEDYEALVGQYRAEAKRLLRVLDEDAKPRRAQVEALVERRLRREGLLGGEAKGAEKGTEAKPAKGGAGEAAVAASAPAPAATRPLRHKKKGARKADADGLACASCGTRNDADATFCKKCGARQGAAAADAEADAKPKDEAGEGAPGTDEHEAPKGEAGE
jgi:hypothetical protein